MDLKLLYDTIPSWEWPADTDKKLREILENRSADANDRLMAAELAGDSVVMNDTLAGTLLAIVGDKNEPEELRASAAISIGPALEHAYIFEFDDPDDLILSEKAFHKAQETLKTLYLDAGVPARVRRSILEAAVRAPQDWHSNAVRAAYLTQDESWRLTSVFCMRFLKGFDRQILESLESQTPRIRYHAVSAAGNWGLNQAWPVIAGLLAGADTEMEMRLAAIDAAAGIGTPEAVRSLIQLLDSNDQDVVDAATEALAMLGAAGFDDEFDDEDE